MPRKKAEFPSPYELSIPGTEGWERMYSETLIMPKERKKEFEGMSIFQEHMHWPRVLKPYDADCTDAPALRGLNTYQHRAFVLPTSRGIHFFIVNGWHYGTEIPPYTDPKLIEQRTAEFLRRMIYCWFNWNKIYPKWKQDVWKLLKEQEALGNQIRDLPELEDLSLFSEVRGITSARKLVELYDRAVHLYLTVFEGYQYQFIGAAYGTDYAFWEFCHKAFPEIDDRTVGNMLTGAELEAFRPDEEVKRLAHLAVDLGLAPAVKEQKKFEDMRSEFQRTGKGKKWLREFEKSSQWFNMMVTQGIFAQADEPCWIEDIDIILGFLKNYIEKIERGEKIERDVKALLQEKKQLFEKHYGMLKTDEEKHRFKELYNLASTFYVFVEEQGLFIKNFDFALFRRNVKKFAEIIAKHGLIKEPDDIFFLRLHEIKSVLEALDASWGAGEPPTTFWIKEIEWRKKIIEKFEKWDRPRFLGPWKKELIEPFVVMGGGGINKNTLDLYRKPTKPEKVKELKGIGVSTGKVEGIARVIERAADISKIRPGEILVCEHTTPAWTPAFAVIKGIVTNMGGVLSHAGIVAREYGMPAVLNTWIGTSVIKTGYRIRVDSDEGVVTILSR